VRQLEPLLAMPDLKLTDDELPALTRASTV
jgi:hypothetical protein